MTRAMADLLVSHVPRKGPPRICVPRAAMRISTHVPTAGVPVRLTSRSTDRYGFIGALRWSVGHRRSAGRSVVRRFARPGRYRVVLRVLDTSGASASVVRILRVRAPRCVERVPERLEGPGCRV